MTEQEKRRLRRREWLERRLPSLACALATGAVLGMRPDGAAIGVAPWIAACMAAISAAGFFRSRLTELAETAAQKIGIEERLAGYRSECLCWMSCALVTAICCLAAGGGRIACMIACGLAAGALAASWRSVRLAGKMERLADSMAEEGMLKAPSDSMD